MGASLDMCYLTVYCDEGAGATAARGPARTTAGRWTATASSAINNKNTIISQEIQASTYESCNIKQNYLLDGRLAWYRLLGVMTPYNQPVPSKTVGCKRFWKDIEVYNSSYMTKMLIIILKKKLGKHGLRLWLYLPFV